MTRHMASPGFVRNSRSIIESMRNAGHGDQAIRSRFRALAIGALQCMEDSRGEPTPIEDESRYDRWQKAWEEELARR